MSEIVKTEPPIFLVKSVLGKLIRTHKIYWDKIIQIKHPEAKLELSQIKLTLQNSTMFTKASIAKTYFYIPKSSKIKFL